jgi:HlyD family secretion protein
MVKEKNINRNKKNKTIVLIFTFVSFIIVGVLTSPLFFKKNSKGSFQFKEVSRGDIENIVSSTGTLSAIETINVGSQVSGIVEKIYVDYNDPVKKGQLLAVLEKTLFNVSVRDAQAGIFRSKAQLKQAEVEVKRNEPLFKKGHLSEMEFLVLRTNVDTAKANFRSAEQTLKKAQTQLDFTEIRSPIDGTVIERSVDVGQTIAASFQAPQLFIVAEDLTQMQIEANVDESDIGLIKEGQGVRFTVLSYPDEGFNGVVRQIRLQPTTLQNVVNYTVVVDAKNEEMKLLPGMTATVDFLVEEKRDVLLVSNTALNFKPTMEMMKEFMNRSRKEKEGNKNRAMGGDRMGSEMSMGKGMPGMGGNQRSNKMGRLFYLDEMGQLKSAMFVKGATDGISTEVLKSRNLEEGMIVITGFSKETKKESDPKKAGFFMRPGPQRK